MAFHVFYASDSNPILSECVRPLVSELRADGLIDRWFFIRYWEEGPHLRLRFRPATSSHESRVRSRVLSALGTFLKRRPALYEVVPDDVDDLYKRMHVAEYGEESWNAKYGSEGRMPLRPNNSIAELPYEPEYGRYGGIAGIDLAEWHFERSSDIVLDLVATTSTHVRQLLIGLSMQLSLVLAYTFLDADESVRGFFRNYRDFWETAYVEPSDSQHDSFDKSYEIIADSLLARVDRIREMSSGRRSAPSEFEKSIVGHARELRQAVERLIDQGAFDFSQRQSEDEQMRRETVFPQLVSAYIHMTNNRLGMAIIDEIYLSYLVEKALTVTAAK
ncbi:MAG: thiopeptide-type bacteriocin biosynthesis protein [Bifidobacteriaceae bacterium]|nr:thiopeptide-type bacteriocin biosynthesis protein [Bifidobacteriaceae bacterium]